MGLSVRWTPGFNRRHFRRVQQPVAPEHRSKRKARETHATIDQQVAPADAAAGRKETHVVHLIEQL
jgi:hypothetical protein